MNAMTKLLILLVSLSFGCAGGDQYEAYDTDAGEEVGTASLAISKNHRFGVTDIDTRCDAIMASSARCYYPNDKTVRYSVDNTGMSFFEGMSVSDKLSTAIAKIVQAQGTTSLKYTFAFESTPSLADVVFSKGSLSPLVTTDDIRNFSRVFCQVAGPALSEPVAIQGTHHICSRFQVTLDMTDIMNRAGSGNFGAMLEHALGFGLMGSMGAGITPVTSVNHTFTSRQVVPFGKTTAHSAQEKCLGQEFSTSFEPTLIRVDNRCNDLF